MSNVNENTPFLQILLPKSPKKECSNDKLLQESKQNCFNVRRTSHLEEFSFWASNTNCTLKIQQGSGKNESSFFDSWIFAEVRYSWVPWSGRKDSLGVWFTGRNSISRFFSCVAVIQHIQAILKWPWNIYKSGHFVLLVLAAVQGAATNPDWDTAITGLSLVPPPRFFLSMKQKDSVNTQIPQHKHVNHKRAVFWENI